MTAPKVAGEGEHDTGSDYPAHIPLVDMRRMISRLQRLDKRLSNRDLREVLETLKQYVPEPNADDC